jgi:rhodanese-related sulfurtransferase
MMKKMSVWMLSVSLFLSLTSMALAQSAQPAAAPAGPPKVVQDMLASAKAAVTKVPAADVKVAIDKKEKAVYLDVRDPNEYAAGHLPGAINVSRGPLEMNIWKAFPDQTAKIYVYCKTAGRSALATKTLNDLGYKNAVLMDAQFEDWIKAGYPVVR